MGCLGRLGKMLKWAILVKWGVWVVLVSANSEKFSQDFSLTPADVRYTLPMSDE